MITASDLRSQLTLSDDHIHLNNAGVGPLTRAGQEAMTRMVQLQGQQAFAAIPEIIETYNGTRQAFAELVGATPDDVSMMQTCAAAISQVALGLSYEAGQEIVLCDQEYPSNAYPWYEAARRHSLEVKCIASSPNLNLQIENLLEAITEKTKVVALSWVQYQSGTCMDLKTIKQRCESVGAGWWSTPFKVWAWCPFRTTRSSQTSSVGARTSGFAVRWGTDFWSRRSASSSAEPHHARGNTYGTPEDLVVPGKAMRTDCGRFEPGNPLLWGAVAGAASIRVLLEIGIAAIHERALHLSNRLIEGIQESGGRLMGQPVGSRTSPIVTFAFDERDMDDCHRWLLQHKVTGSSRAGGIRLAPHAFNTEEEIQQVIELLAAWVRR